MNPLPEGCTPTLSSREHRIWVSGVPKSQQAKGKHSDGYRARVQAAAREEIFAPLHGRVELVIVYSALRAPQLDTDNAAKLIQDALIGIAYADDRQVRDTRIVALTEESLRSIDDQPHRTFARVLDGNDFPICVVEKTAPSIATQLESS